MTTLEYYTANIQNQQIPQDYTGERKYCFQPDGYGAIVTLTEHYLMGRLHRVDGPAVHSIDGIRFYYIQGQKIDEDAFWNNLAAVFWESDAD